MSDDLENERGGLSDAELDALLADARGAVAAPSPAFMARVLADAAETSVGFEAPPRAPEAERRTGFGGWLGRFLSFESPLGPIVVGAASVAMGVWLGASAPEDVTTSAGEMITAMGADMILMDGAVSFELAELDIAMLDEDDF